MAKSTKGKSKTAQDQAKAEDVAQDVTDAIEHEDTDQKIDPVEDNADTVSDDPAGEISDSAIEDADTIEDAETLDAEETSDAPLPAPAVVQEKVIERKGGFFPLILGGVLAAGIGVVSAEYIFPNGLPFGPAATERIDFNSALKLQAGRIDDLQNQLESQPTIDTGALDAAVAAVGDLQAQIGAVVENVSGIEARIAELEAQPASDGSGVSVAMENELKELRAALDLQKGEIAQMINEAQNTKQSAEETARQTMARAAVTRILVALDSGSPFDDALADVQANSDVTIPEALAQTATTGVPTLSSLSETYPDAARAALAAVRREDTGGGVANFLAKQLGARSVAPREGDDPDAVLSRVEAALGEGRIADALAQAEVLPDAAKAPLADWIAQANLRLTAAREAEALANSLNSQ